MSNAKRQDFHHKVKILSKFPRGETIHFKYSSILNTEGAAQSSTISKDRGVLILRGELDGEMNKFKHVKL